MKILILANNDAGLYGFRKELLAELAKTNEIVIAVPSGKHQSYFEQCGYKYIDVPVDRRGMNYQEDDSLTHYGTLTQIICRICLEARSEAEMEVTKEEIRKLRKAKNTEGEEMLFAL